MAGELFAVGDLQGCLESLKGLLEQLPKSAHIIFVGDIVNRGPQSLKTLRKVKKLCDSGRAEMVLGNHDLHLLAVAAGAGRVHRKDTIGEILEARDCDELIDWLRKQPLIINTPDTVFVHAGIPPAWTLKDALSHAEEAHRALAGDDWKAYLQGMYGNDNYSDSLSGPARMRAILNGLTRMRFMDPEGNPDYSIKEGLGAAPAGYKPWFECPGASRKRSASATGRCWGSCCGQNSLPLTPDASGAERSLPCGFPTGAFFRNPAPSGRHLPADVFNRVDRP